MFRRLSLWYWRLFHPPVFASKRELRQRLMDAVYDLDVCVYDLEREREISALLFAALTLPPEDEKFVDTVYDAIEAYVVHTSSPIKCSSPD